MPFLRGMRQIKRILARARARMTRQLQLESFSTPTRAQGKIRKGENILAALLERNHSGRFKYLQYSVQANDNYSHFLHLRNSHCGISSFGTGNNELHSTVDQHKAEALKENGQLGCHAFGEPIDSVIGISGRIKNSYTKRAERYRDKLRLRREVIAKLMQQNQINVQLLLKRKILQEALQGRKDRIRDAEQKLREKGRLIIQDLRETKNLVKVRVEQVVEKENIYTIPNLLCLTRIVFSPYLGYLIVTENFEYALGFMVVAGCSDWLDGWIARNYASQSTKIGSFLDPMADKVLIGTLFLSLTYVDLIPAALTILIIARDVALVVAGFVIRYVSLPPPRTFVRYFDASHATAQLAPTMTSKINTGVQLVLVGSTLAAPVFGYVGHPLMDALCGVTAASTILAAASYILSKDTYKYLGRK